jgi:hypothetical protein
MEGVEGMEGMEGMEDMEGMEGSGACPVAIAELSEWAGLLGGG